MFKPQITNKLSYFVVVGFREIESLLKNIYLLLLIGGLQTNIMTQIFLHLVSFRQTTSVVSP